MKFCFVHIVKICFVFKNSVNKTLPTLGNKKEQILQKIVGRVDFLLATENLKMFYCSKK